MARLDEALEIADEVWAQPITSDEFHDPGAVLRAAVCKYPRQLAERLPLSISVCASIDLPNGEAPGMRVGPDELHLVIATRDRGFVRSGGGIERALHELIGSVVFSAYPVVLDEESWRAWLPPDFGYQQSRVAGAPKGRGATPWSRGEYAAGFLDRAGFASLEQDRNQYFAGLFVGDQFIWGSARVFRRARGKLNCMLQALGQIDESLSAEYFLKLRPVSPRCPVMPVDKLPR